MAPKLAKYRAKRDFTVTAEPSGERTPQSAGNSFVIQKHAARRLHYDFRLELDGVLLSWSVPKGPSLSLKEKRLAVRVEDHPLDYADFEGIIPKGQYGGGTVVVWDRGTWAPDGDAHDMLARGRMTFTLAGTKLHGKWHLVKTKPQGKQESWLLFKGRDEAASERGDLDEHSVISGRTLEQVEHDADRVWSSNKPGDVAALVGALPLGFRLTNLDKILYPEQGITKAQLIAYYAVVAEHMLPYVAGRPLTLVRCPEGHGKPCFFQKHLGAGTPAAVEKLPIKENGGTDDVYMMIRDMPGLVALAQLGCLEVHTWGSHAPDVDKPDIVVFDLDPDVGLGWEKVALAAFDLRRRLHDRGLDSFVKTTGGKGLHICVPITPRGDFDDVKAWAKAFAEQLEHDDHAAYTSVMTKARRKGKIFVDYLRNGRNATFIAPYSTRARAGAPVAVPISWEELAHGVDPARFTIATVPARLARIADPWKAYATTRQALPRRKR